MMFSKKEWMECISYGAVGLFSMFMFVFGLMFPEYTFVTECYDKRKAEEIFVVKDYNGNVGKVEDFQRLQELLKEKDYSLTKHTNMNEEGEIKITCLSYEYLKEIINGWD